MPEKIPRDEKRTLEQLKEQYEIEKELAARLRNASKAERQYLYNALYDELYSRVSHHPRLTRRQDEKTTRKVIYGQMQLLGRYLKPDTVFMEIGPGDCSLSFEVAKQAKKVYAVDVSTEATGTLDFPPNCELVITDGCSIPVPENSVSVAYSHQLMEHLHPDDAFEQLRNIYRALCPGGVYICITPNGITGPHDISQYFDDVPTGFHLKEYTLSGLYDLFYATGFSKVNAFVALKQFYLKNPALIFKSCESFLEALPASSRKKVARTLPFRKLLKIRVVGTK